MNHESYFERFRRKIIGIDQTIETPYGTIPLLYADWIASGRLYQPIEQTIAEEIGPWVANTHSESSTTGKLMTYAYHEAAQAIKAHVGAHQEDVLLPCGNGATAAINKLQRLMGLKVHERWQSRGGLPPSERPVVFVTHMEHHSNHTSWLETIADVVILPPDDFGLVSPQMLEEKVERYRDRPLLIGSFTACSNVTGLRTPYHDLARVMHRHGGVCFVDFAASAPYDPICMHPSDSEGDLDAIFFSPHRFLGGPGSSGILVFHKSLYHNQVPDQPGGGTVAWTNPWGGRKYSEEIEIREDGGTPGFLQLIRAALAIRVKIEMGTARIHDREQQIVTEMKHRLSGVPNVHLLGWPTASKSLCNGRGGDAMNQIGVVSFYVPDLHYNLVVQLLNDRYGIQTRGGCLCAGTYGHYLLGITQEQSQSITIQIDSGNLDVKPGWVRVSLHPTMTDAEIEYVSCAITEIAQAGKSFAEDYIHQDQSGIFVHKAGELPRMDVRRWFFLNE
jgi:selenocysteine lyase/cysteine desulfurase